jgi:hypothetical protein
MCAATIVSCSKNEGEQQIKNGLIKRTTSPLVVGEQIYFAYAAASMDGMLKTLRVEASTPGGEGTGYEPYTWRTGSNGVDVSTEVASSCSTSGALSEATLKADIQSTTLRYYYTIPEALRGKEVSFVFSAVSTTGHEINMQTPSYKVSALNMKKNITMLSADEGARYFSIEDMRAYTLAEVEAGNLSGKIDFIYAYAEKKNVGENQYDYKHAFFSPAATAYYPDDFSIPASWTKNSTLMDKKLYVWDGQLKNDPNNGVYVDDSDLLKQTFDNSVDYVLDIRTEGSVFMQTASKKYAAYIYINGVTDNSQTAEVGIKRYTY